MSTAGTLIIWLLVSEENYLKYQLGANLNFVKDRLDAHKRLIKAIISFGYYLCYWQEHTLHRWIQ